MLHSVSEDGLDLLAGVSGIPLVHDIQKRRELVFRLAIAVDAVIDGDKTHPLIREEYLRVITHLKIVPADS